MVSVPGLIADIGATNARFALADERGIYQEKVLKCADYRNLKDAASAYLDTIEADAPPQDAAIAIAGPVKGDEFSMTNHPWRFSVRKTQDALGLARLNLMNDFKALALAVPHLKDKDLRQIGGESAVPDSPVGIIGPGTGLGVASLVPHDGRYIAVSGEGGHVTMPAKTQREFDLFATLIEAKYSHISAERVCSGKGLVNIYNGLRTLDARGDLPARGPEEISTAGISNSCPLCRESLRLMAAFLGRVSGNLALTLGAFGGIYIAGGIVNRWGDFFDTSSFRNEFESKGRFTDYMKPIPVFVIEHPFPAFIGLQAAIVKGKID